MSNLSKTEGAMLTAIRDEVKDRTLVTSIILPLLQNIIAPFVLAGVGYSLSYLYIIMNGEVALTFGTGIIPVIHPTITWFTKIVFFISLAIASLVTGITFLEDDSRIALALIKIGEYRNKGLIAKLKEENYGLRKQLRSTTNSSVTPGSEVEGNYTDKVRELREILNHALILYTRLQENLKVDRRTLDGEKIMSQKQYGIAYNLLILSGIISKDKRILVDDLDIAHRKMAEYVKDNGW